MADSNESFIEVQITKIFERIKGPQYILSLGHRTFTSCRKPKTFDVRNIRPVTVKSKECIKAPHRISN